MLRRQEVDGTFCAPCAERQIDSSHHAWQDSTIEKKGNNLRLETRRAQVIVAVMLDYDIWIERVQYGEKLRSSRHAFYIYDPLVQLGHSLHYDPLVQLGPIICPLELQCVQVVSCSSIRTKYDEVLRSKTALDVVRQKEIRIFCASLRRNIDEFM